MKNTVSFTKFIESLGCRLRLGYYWSALSADKRRAVFTIWDDGILNDEYTLIPDGNPKWMRLPGAIELKKHIPIALAEGCETFGILCHAEDPNAEPRHRAYYDEKSLLALKVEQKGKKVIATILGDLDVKDVKTGNASSRIRDRKSALNDIDEIPDGTVSPPQFLALTSQFKRDSMVRDYVKQQAKGKCEYCGSIGFEMSNGRKFLEAHHILSLANDGPDTVDNVIALCPNHHREAHYGVHAVEMNIDMLKITKNRK